MPEDERDDLDGCKVVLDDTERTDDDEAESLLIAEGDEEDELDDNGDPLPPMSPDRGLATRARRVADLLGENDRPLFKVRESKGWKERGRKTQGIFNPKGSVNHHTAAGPPPPDAPSLGIVINGRSDLPGPLCNGLQTYSDKLIVVAAGVANHAGSGGFRGATGNASMYGLEVEHTGTKTVGKQRVAVMVGIHVAFLWRPGSDDLDWRMVCQHREWSSAGKIDFARNFVTEAQADAFRQMVKEGLEAANREHRRRKRR